MDFIQLLGKHLKDNSVLELLEQFEIDVIYDFDRTHEGMGDVYWAAFQDQGFLLRFDHNQKLDVIFLYISPHEGFISIPESEIDVPVYSSFSEAKNAFKEECLEYLNSPSNDPNDRWYQRWIKANHENYTSHYEFVDKQLRKITLSVVNDAE